MNRATTRRAACALALLASAGCNQATTAPDSLPNRSRQPVVATTPTATAVDPLTAPDASGARPLTALPYTPGLDLSAMDKSADPCADFYAYACGGWQKLNPIPADQPRWTVYGKLQNENRQFLWGLLAEAARPAAGRSAEQQKIGDYFASCMDEAAVEAGSGAALQAELKPLAAVDTKEQLAGWLGRTHLSFTSANLLFGLGAGQDPGNSEQVIAFLFGGGIGLPDRDYYLKDDAKSKETRERYQAHVSRMLSLAGDQPEQANAGAATILRLETALAKASLSRVDKRDPHKTYHRMKITDLQALVPTIRWSDYLAPAQLDGIAELNVTEPGFFKELEARLQQESLEDLKTYLRFHLVSARAPYLGRAFVEADFEFYRAYLRGVKELRPRWKRCVDWVDRDLGEALGKEFVAKVFPAGLKEKTLSMTQHIQAAMAQRIAELDWMGPETRKQALAKLASMRNKIGYPDKWREYTKFEVRRDDFVGNVSRGIVFESLRQAAQVGQPIDRGEWLMTPPTVNAYYNASMNDINFPAGILLPPLFDPKMDDAPNYGNTGATIGHEVIHGFDDEGSKFDGLGNLRDWWTANDRKEFDNRTSCVANQYAGYTVVDDIKINSALSLGEDVADLGGTVLAWIAWRRATEGQKLEPRDGLTPEQRFFIGYGQWVCENETPENLRVSAVTNPHSPGRWRINGVVANMPEFAAAFSCKAGQPTVAARPCVVW